MKYNKSAKSSIRAFWLAGSFLFLIAKNISAQATTINISSEQNTQKVFDDYVNEIKISNGRQSFC